MTMNIFRGLNSGCGCGHGSDCCNPGNGFEPFAGYGYGCSRNRVGPACACARQNSRYCCNSGCNDGEGFFAASGRYGFPGNPPCGCDTTAIKILCVDEDCNGVCNAVFTLESPDGCCKTIDLKNCGRSADLSLPCGCTTLKNVSVPHCFRPLEGTIFCEVSDDSCGHPVCTVTSEGCAEDRISVRRECGTTVITLKFPRKEGTGCGDGCDCSGL